MKLSPAFRFTFEVAKGFWPHIGGIAFIGLIWALDQAINPYLLKIMVNAADPDDLAGSVQRLVWPAIGYLSLSLIVVLAWRVYNWIWMYMNVGMQKHIGQVLMDRCMHHSLSSIQDQFAGSLGTKIKDVMSGVSDMLALLLMHFFTHFISLMLSIFVLSTVASKFAIFLAVWALVYIVGGQILCQRMLNPLMRTASEKRSELVGHMVDVLGNLLSIKLFSRGPVERSALNRKLDAYGTASIKRDWALMMVFVYQGLSFVIYQGVCMYWLVTGFGAGSITAGDFAMILTINIAIVKMLWNVSEDIYKLSNYVGTIEQGLSFAETAIEIEDRPQAPSLQVTKGAISFENVEFKYKGASPLFKGTSVDIKPGQRVGLVGYSGAGKSSFVNLLLRLFEVNKGRILVDDQDIRDVTQDSLRAQMGMIPQDPSLFHRTLFENIAYGASQGATRETVIEAAKAAHAHEFITALPQGYDSTVGERGVKLSGGQRQRIAIARAFVKNAPILILDEATSQLDSATEQQLQESLLKLMAGKTSLVIAHRLSTLLYMDRILVFDQGKIVQDGSHKELVLQQGLYKTLWDAQVGGFLPEAARP